MADDDRQPDRQTRTAEAAVAVAQLLGENEGKGCKGKG
jgi:hypothetical protein